MTQCKVEKESVKLWQQRLLFLQQDVVTWSLQPTANHF